MTEKKMKTKRRSRTMLVPVIISAFLVAYFSTTSCTTSSPSTSAISPPHPSARAKTLTSPSANPSKVGAHPLLPPLWPLLPPPPASILFHYWEVLVVLPDNNPPFSSSGSVSQDCTCLFQDGVTPPAFPAGVIPSSGSATFKCWMPFNLRRLRPFFPPALTHLSEILCTSPENGAKLLEMLRWIFLAYESFSTDDDVLLFAKGHNSRQGINIPSSSLHSDG